MAQNRSRMIIQFISDIHLERRPSERDYTKIIKPIASVLILAGDIGKLRPDTLSPFIDYCCANWVHVLYVAGNHEFYDTTQCREAIIEQLHGLSRPNLHFMNRDIVTIDGQRFLGCTLWSKPLSSIGLNDFNQIRTTKDCLPISIHTMADWHDEDLRWLTDHVREGDVVITHFMPLTNLDLIGCRHPSIYPVSQHDLYFGNIDCWKLFKRRPKLWISGHTHQRFDVRFRADLDSDSEPVRWVCNPYGYPGEYTGDTEPFTSIPLSD